SGGGAAPARPAVAQVGWYGHLRTLAGAGRRSLDFEQRAQESAATDRTIPVTPFVRMAGQQHRLVALTFDDGPSAYSDRLMDVLARLRVPATFFLIGYNLPQFGPQLQREVDLGLTVGDHTADHPNLSQLSAGDQRRQIVDDASEIHSFGAPYPRLFRPPYGAWNQTTRALLARQRMLGVLWSVDSEDYTKPGVDAIVHNVVSAVQPGSIVLMHDGGGDRTETIAALPLIVRALRREGYGFASVPQLMLENPPPLEQGLAGGFDSGGAG
ncbi:MAG TPA: polysaccharide deacetylase family protein, partial [Conexibacter sp.]|nr:polysaccharide deacetylase family protein [Conexibacter sp.]